MRIAEFTFDRTRDIAWSAERARLLASLAGLPPKSRLNFGKAVKAVVGHAIGQGKTGSIQFGLGQGKVQQVEAIVRYPQANRTETAEPRLDRNSVAEMIGKDYVYCRKPTPAHISNDGDWELMEKDLKITYDATKKHGCSTELVVRDVYDIQGDMKRLSKWVELAKKTFGI